MLAVSIALVIMLSVIAFIMFFKDLYKMAKEPSFGTFKDICFSGVVFVFCTFYVNVSLLLQEVV